MPAYPFCVPPRELRRVVPGGRRAKLVMPLPVGPEGQPLPPGEVVHTEGVLLSPHTVQGLALPPAEAVTWLTAPGGVAGQEAGGLLSLGDDLRVWARAALLTLELLGRERFVPVLERDEAGTYRAVWRLLPFTAGDAARIKALSAALPGVALAVAPAGWSAYRVVADFLQACADGCIRAWLGGDGERAEVLPPGKLPAALRVGLRGAGRQGRLLARWLAGLVTPGGRVSGDERELEELAGRVASWLEPVWGQGGPFRTCFRLDPPEEVDAGGRVEAGDGRWALRFFLQASDDPSLLVPAREVWAGGADLLVGGAAQPQERLLADLARAARLFAPVERGLASPCPEECLLEVEEAYRFLTEGAPLLEEYGFGVLLPAWWAKGPGRPRLGVQLRVRPAAGGARSGILGMDSLVEYDWQVALGDDTLDPEEFRRLAELKVPLVKVRGQWVELRPEEIRAALERWERRAGRMRLGEALRLGLEGSLPGGVPVSVRGEGDLAGLWDALPEARFCELPTPAGFRGELRPYQVRGYSWLAFLRRLGMGACLADDMGLGKTIQLIALLLHEREQGLSRGPTLLVCPTSVLGNWEREVHRFAPSLRVLVHHGPERAAGEQFARAARQHDLVITSYPLVARDLDTLRVVEWEGVVLDEAQNIKNPSARQAQAVRELRATYRVALTGTPVENHLGELWSIMDFLNPGYLGPAARFRETFAIPIERYGDSERAARLRRLVGPFILRRAKSDPGILDDLPPKQEGNVYCPLTREQATLYEAVVREMLERVEDSEGIQRKGLILGALTRLKQVCNHPAHFLGDGSRLEGRSGKLERLREMLEEVLASGDRALVFTQFRQMGALLRQYLEETFGVPVLFLHGGVPRSERDRMVAAFQAARARGPRLFVLSLKAGGVGLNLTAARFVFHYDRWWNPAVEDQATDRAHRIGQTGPVQVYRLICQGTLEDRIAELIESKRALADRVVGKGESWLTELSTEEIRRLVVLDRRAVVD